MPQRRIDDPQYVQGQIEALQAVVLGIAHLLLDPNDFRQESLERIETVRTAITFSPASDAWLDGLNEIERWVKALT